MVRGTPSDTVELELPAPALWGERNCCNLNRGGIHRFVAQHNLLLSVSCKHSTGRVRYDGKIEGKK